jgi:hypothetical protein
MVVAVVALLREPGVEVVALLLGPTVARHPVAMVGAAIVDRCLIDDGTGALFQYEEASLSEFDRGTEYCY